MNLFKVLGGLASGSFAIGTFIYGMNLPDTGAEAPICLAVSFFFGGLGLFLAGSELSKVA